MTDICNKLFLQNFGFLPVLVIDDKNGWNSSYLKKTDICNKLLQNFGFLPVLGIKNGWNSSYLKKTFLVQLAQVTPDFQYYDMLDGKGYCLEVNGIKGRKLYLERCSRYYFTFQIPAAVSDCKTGYVPPQDSENYRFQFSTSPQGDDVSTLAPLGLDFQIKAGDTLWCSLPRCTSELIYYGLADKDWAGGAIEVYGGEDYTYN